MLIPHMIRNCRLLNNSKFTSVILSFWFVQVADVTKHQLNKYSCKTSCFHHMQAVLIMSELSLKWKAIDSIKSSSKRNFRIK